jgi:hypothetical protein
MMSNLPDIPSINVSRPTIRDDPPAGSELLTVEKLNDGNRSRASSATFVSSEPDTSPLLPAVYDGRDRKGYPPLFTQDPLTDPNCRPYGHVL